MAEVRCGIDVGTQGMRAVRAKRGAHGWQLLAAAEVSRYDSEGHERSFAQMLEEIQVLITLKGAACYLVDSTTPALVRYISSVPLPEDRLERLIRLELEQHAEDGDLAADMRVLPVGGDELICCCVLAQPHAVAEQLAYFQADKLRVARVGAPIAAAFNVAQFAEDPDVDDEHTVRLLIDMGRASTRVLLMRGREFLACRTINIGGEQFTQAFMEARGVTYAQAEQMKRVGVGTSNDTTTFVDMAFQDESGASASGHHAVDALAETADPAGGVAAADEAAASDAEGHDADLAADPWIDDDDLIDLDTPTGASSAARPLANTNVDDGKQRGERELDLGDESAPRTAAPGLLNVVLQQVARDMFAQIQGSVTWMRSQIQQSKLQVDEVLLAGAAARVPGFQRYLEEQFRRPVRFLPERFELQKGEITQAYFGAFGAVLAGVPRGKGALATSYLDFDLRPESVLRQQVWQERVIWPRVAGGLLVAAALVYGVHAFLFAGSMETSLEAHQEHNQTRQRLERELEQLKSRQNALLEDMRGIASRLFAGRDLLNLMRIIKAKAPDELWVTRIETVSLRDRSESFGGDERSARGGFSRRDRSRRGGGSSEVAEHVDTAIERGQIEIHGMVKSQSDATARSQVYEQWRDAVVNAEDEYGNRLFTNNYNTEIERKNEDGEDLAEGSFIFTLRVEIEPTKLDEFAPGSDAP